LPYPEIGHENRSVILRTVQTLSFKPKNCPIPDFAAPSRLIRVYLQSLGDKAGPLTVLKPLVLRKKKQLPEAVSRWKAEIDSLELSESMNRLLTELMENAVTSRFPKMNLKEIQKMLHYTPLEKTVAGQELIMMGIEKGRIEGIEKGIEKGKIIGKIHATQRFLKRRITSEKKLLRYGIGELRAELKQLEAELKHS
jgi:hypothetical protein